MKYFDQIKDIINSSNLQEKSKQDFINFWKNVNNDNELKPVIELFTKKPELIQVIEDNYKKKLVAMRNLDQQTWKQILKEEQEQMLKMNTEE